MIALFVFFLLRLTPGDPAAIIGGDYATAQQMEEIRESLGLNKALGEQLFLWTTRALQGELGQSYYFKKPVSELILQRIQPTVALTICTMIIAVVVAVPFGVLAAWFRGSIVDRLVMAFSVLGFSVPAFVVGYALIYVFSLAFGWLPVQGYVHIQDGVIRFLEHMVLPSLAIAAGYIALVARVTRASILEILSEDFIRTARAKGLTDGEILVRHVMRNAAIPVVTVIGIGVTMLLGGVVVTESVFNIPGLGKLTVEAVLARDYPTIQAVILVFALFCVMVNLVVDVVYTAVDPRIRY